MLIEWTLSVYKKIRANRMPMNVLTLKRAFRMERLAMYENICLALNSNSKKNSHIIESDILANTYTISFFITIIIIVTYFDTLLVMKRSILLFALSGLMSASVATNYTAHAPFCYSNNAVIRTFDLDGERKQLVVNVDTLKTSIQGMVRTIGHPCRGNRYTRLLREASAAPFPLSNDGITRQKSGTALTTDLCPSSKKGFEQALYATIIKKMKNPVPVTLFITGKWIEHHQHALSLFRRCERDGKLAITWGNHTYTHPYSSKLPDEQNFSLTPGYDLRADTLKLEKYLIELGITPSVFFRFPGLISDKRAIEIIRDLGLITIGSDTWLAIGQKIKPGSIILLHGNLNEPRGVKMFLDLLDKGKVSKLEPLDPQ